MASVANVTRVAVVNQKGGVGKTTVTLGLAATAAMRGARVLVVDLDPQANATSGLGVAGAPRSVDDALAGAQPAIDRVLLLGATAPALDPTGCT